MPDSPDIRTSNETPIKISDGRRQSAGPTAGLVVYEHQWDASVFGVPVHVGLRITLQEQAFVFYFLVTAFGQTVSYSAAINGDGSVDLPVTPLGKLVALVSEWERTASAVSFDLAITYEPPSNIGLTPIRIVSERIVVVIPSNRVDASNAQVAKTAAEFVAQLQLSQLGGRVPTQSPPLAHISRQHPSRPIAVPPNGLHLRGTPTVEAGPRISAQSQSLYAEGSAGSFIFYINFGLNCQGWHFEGNAGGVSVPGVTLLAGNIATDNFDGLVSATQGFSFTALPNYFQLTFFNGWSGEALGTFYAGAVGTISGGGAGSGKWTQR
jgi:hypothetical protein